ncbi:MAG: hypothetical protein LBT16_05530 [Treponema sp.]|jgi:hypothetical protein|nr:hypothetical protein [Treponema sp.]
MAKQYYYERFEHEGKMVLGLDTGLSAQAFAQAKMAQYITQAGCIVHPETDKRPGAVELWRAGGVLERGAPSPTMVVWGPDFLGEPLDSLIAPARDSLAGGNALEALSAWIRSRAALPPECRACPPWPGAALLARSGREDAPPYPAGTVLFLPEAITRRLFDARGDEAWIGGAERWVHPDLQGEEAEAFTAAALYYRILCGVPPFPSPDRDALREDIREAIFIPPSLAAPGLNTETANLIGRALSPAVKLRDQKLESAPPPGNEKGGRSSSPRPADFIRLIGETGKRKDLFFRPLGAEERAKLETEREQYRRKTEKTVKARRFIRRNRTALAAALAGAAIVILLVTSIFRNIANQPTTRGLSPQEVVETYYNAFTALDHATMEACVTDKAGKDDISMATNIFVLSKVREAYEIDAMVITPRKWLENGGGPTTKQVFGISDLDLFPLDADDSDGKLSFRTEYRFWTPYAAKTAPPDFETADAELSGPEPSLPSAASLRDELTLVRNKKGLWHIAAILRDIKQ